MSRISAEQNEIARTLYREGRAFGVTGVSTKAPRRVHCGYDDTAWSKPLLIVYGSVTDKTAVRALAAGWSGDLEFQT